MDAEEVPIVVVMRATQAAKCLGWPIHRVMARARADGVLVDARDYPRRFFGSRDRWFVPESWVDRIGEPARAEGGG